MADDEVVVDQEVESQDTGEPGEDGEGIEAVQMEIDDSATPGEGAALVKAEPVAGGAALLDPKKAQFLGMLDDKDLVAVEAAMLEGNYGKLSSRQRMAMVWQKCMALGLNPALSPFVWAKMRDKLTLVRTKSAGSQLRSIHNIGCRVVDQFLNHDLGIFAVWVEAFDRRTKEVLDVDLGVVGIKNQTGEALGNSMMMAITKAKNRVTESCCGAGGGSDDLEAESVNYLEEGRKRGEISAGPKTIDPKKKLRPTGQEAREHAQQEGSGVDPSELEGLDEEEGRPIAPSAPPPTTHPKMRVEGTQPPPPAGPSAPRAAGGPPQAPKPAELKKEAEKAGGPPQPPQVAKTPLVTPPPAQGAAAGPAKAQAQQTPAKAPPAAPPKPVVVGTPPRGSGVAGPQAAPQAPKPQAPASQQAPSTSPPPAAPGAAPKPPIPRAAGAGAATPGGGPKPPTKAPVKAGR